ncbi:MAG: adenylate kinase family protein [Candidatus Aenigmarchaeota archaeon]|nr:adenylate kinase family protein [Candidatus Aenigmarchaeota archaeon]
MLISISGTPGTGKTAVAKELSRQLNASIIDLKTVARKLPFMYDKKRKSLVVDPKLLQGAVKDAVKDENFPILLEGHLAHLLDSEIVIVLRTNPVVLEKRLQKRKWSGAKIRENIEAEMLDIIVAEAIEKHGKKEIIEIDSSKKTPKAIAALIVKLMKNPKQRIKYATGKIDWSEKYKKLLID